MDQPRVTVGMPVYNDPDGLRRTIPSVFGQTWRGPLRLLVVDDGSTDDTSKVLESLAKTYGPIDVVRSEINQGRPFARNKIIENVGDDYLAWIDAGDMWHPRKLELQLPTLLDAEKQDLGTPVLCTGSMRRVMASTGEQRVKVPEVSGDQLRNALTGAIPPYLQGIVGRAEHFRAAGGFDERLLRRQDYDFLVRFVGEGGRMVSTAEHVALFTHLRSDTGKAPQLVAAANAALRAKHRQYYEGYGRGLAMQLRGNQHRLVARFYRHNGERARSVAYRIRAKLSIPYPVAATRGLVQRAARTRPTARNVVRPFVMLLRPVLPLLRGPGVIEFARRTGVLRLLNAAGVSRVVYAEVKSEVAEASASSQLTPTGQLPAAVAELEAQVGEVAGPETWLRLEEAYRKAGMLPGAESALIRGLEQHADNERLTVRLIELLPLRKKWAECVELWAECKGLVRTQLRGITYVRVARALRECARPAEALAVAEEGLARWPHELRLGDEVYINRAALVDWQQAVRPAGAADGQGDPAGVVTSLGFMAGHDGPIEGLLNQSGTGASSVVLTVNGMPVVTTFAAGRGSSPGFSFSCYEMVEYLGDGDVISVVSNGERLLIDSYGMACTVTTGYPSRFSELRDLLNAGYIFTKFGTLRMGNTPKRKALTLALYDAVSEILATSHGHVAMPFCGNLLGAIRDHDIIPHDVGGFDMGYFSHHRTSEQVRAEFLDVCRTLVKRGYHLVVLPWSAHIRAKRIDKVFVDLNFAWFSPAGELNVSYGWRHQPVTDEGGVRDHRESLIANYVVRVPGNAEAVLEQIYGPSWAIPDQAFNLDAGLIRATEYLITPDEMNDLLAEFGANRVELQPGAPPDFPSAEVI